MRVQRSENGVNIYSLRPVTEEEFMTDVAIVYPTLEGIARAYGTKANTVVVLWRSQKNKEHLRKILSEKTQTARFIGTYFTPKEIAETVEGVKKRYLYMSGDEFVNHPTPRLSTDSFADYNVRVRTYNSDFLTDFVNLRYPDIPQENMWVSGSTTPEKFATPEHFKLGFYSCRELYHPQTLEELSLGCPVVERALNFVNSTAQNIGLLVDFFSRGCEWEDALDRFSTDLVQTNSRRVRVNNKYVGNVVFAGPVGTMNIAQEAGRYEGVDIGIVVRFMVHGPVRITFWRSNPDVDMSFVKVSPYNGGGDERVAGCTLGEGVTLVPKGNGGYTPGDISTYPCFEDWICKM